MATTGTLSLTLKIGGKDIPISTPIPPTDPNTSIKFTYELTPPTKSPPDYIVSVADFFTWAKNLGFSGTVENLPQKLRSLSVGIKKIVVDTDAGKYDAAVIIGKSDSTTPWDPTWTPIDGLSLSFNDVTLEVDRVP